MNALDSLCAYCGIVDSYLDARRETKTISLQTKRALLAAMGHNGTDESSWLHALEGLQMDARRRGLPPVHVQRRTPHPFMVRIEGTPAAEIQGWRIELESGDIQYSPAGGGVVECALTDEGHARCDLLIGGNLPLGYHTLVLTGRDARCALIVTPGHCWLPPALEEGRKLWGIAAQVYLLRSDDNWGIGDYGDLKRLVSTLKSLDADVVGLSPLHAMFPDDPEQASPYSPASRLLLNVLNIDVTQLIEGPHRHSVLRKLESSGFKEKLARCRAATLVNYAAVAELKFPLLHDIFLSSDRHGSAWKAFRAFRSSAGATFERHCLFLALRLHFSRVAPDMGDWHRWPAGYRSPNSAESIAFAQVHGEDVTFQAWLQFIAEQQLQECSDAAAGMAIGLYRDLAVAGAAGGAETWANAAAVVDHVHIGAPPDVHNPQGQDWALPPFHPLALRAEAYQSFIELVRANMRGAGALRMDHVMALQQLYWIPAGGTPSDGGYVRYPLEDLVGILALESQRQNCLIVGEDLGTVPESFRERMADACILSYRVLFFEQADNRFIQPDRYPELSLAVAGSHDLPTLIAWWQGADIELKRSLDLYRDEAQARQASQAREVDRAALLELLRERGLVFSGGPIDSESFAYAAHRLLASTRSSITMLQFDDLIGEVQPVNVPMTSTQHPNWRRRYSVKLEQLAEELRFVATTCTIRVARQQQSLSV